MMVISLHDRISGPREPGARARPIHGLRALEAGVWFARKTKIARWP